MRLFNNKYKIGCNGCMPYLNPKNRIFIDSQQNITITIDRNYLKRYGYPTKNNKFYSTMPKFGFDNNSPNKFKQRIKSPSECILFKIHPDTPSHFFNDLDSKIKKIIDHKDSNIYSGILFRKENILFNLNLGNDLFDYIISEYPKSQENRFKIPESNWINLAKQIDQLHEINVVHTDIKLENLVLNNNNSKLYLIDLENMNYATNIKHKCTVTTEYSHPDLIRNLENNLKENKPIDKILKNIDQFAFLITFIITKTFTEIKLNEYTVNKITSEYPDVNSIIKNFNKITLTITDIEKRKIYNFFKNPLQENIDGLSQIFTTKTLDVNSQKV